MGIPDHLTSLLRNRYAGQEATVKLDMELVTSWERSMSRLYIVTLFIYLCEEYIMRTAGLDKA